MKRVIFLAGLIALVVLLSGCTQSQPETVYKYVCPDATMVDSPALCRTVECVDCDQYCDDYCAGIVETNGLTVDGVLAEMDAANYCTVKDDCAETETKCPIGCYNIVNVGELERINGLVDDFKQTCFQTCTTLDDFDCVEGKCQPIVPGVG